MAVQFNEILAISGDWINSIRELQQKYTAGQTTVEALNSNVRLIHKALGNCTLGDAITAFLEKLYNAEPTLNEIDEFQYEIQDYELREELSELLNELISRRENVKRIVIEKLKNTKQKLIHATSRIMIGLSSLYQTYILQCTWEDVQNADILMRNQRGEMEIIRQEIENVEKDVKKLSKAMLRYATEKDENKKKEYDEYISNRSAYLREWCVKVRQNLDKLKLTTGQTIAESRMDININTILGVGNVASGIFLGYRAAVIGSSVLTSGLFVALAVGNVVNNIRIVMASNKKAKVFEILLAILEQFGKKLDEFHAILKAEGDLEAMRLEAELDLTD